MKKIYIAILAFLSLTLGSCSNILDENPTGFISPQNFFNTEDEVTSALYGVYQNLHSVYIGDYEKIFIGSIGVDEQLTRTQSRIDVYQYYLMESLTTEYSTTWQELYNAVGDANMVISRTNNSNLSDSFKKEIIGEASFLRAYFYYSLVQMWGDVPMWLDELDVNAVSTLPRTPKADVVAQIEKDLEYAAANLPASWDASKKGRVTSWAAKAFLARVCILNNEWQKAYDNATDVIKNSPHKLLAKYSDIFKWQNKFNDELIFVNPCLKDVRGSSIHSFTNPRGRDEASKFTAAFKSGLTALRPDGTTVNSTSQLFQGWGMFSTSKALLASYEEGDSRKAMMDWSGLTLSDGTYVPFTGGDGGGSGHYCLKWVAFDEPANNGSRDIHLMRLGEVYLILAEAANELGKGTEAVGALNTLRERAFGDKLHDYALTLSKTDIKAALVKEHRWELAGEGTRRWYLIHWGYDYLNAALQSMKEENPKGAANIKPYHVLFKVPDAEFVKNPNLGTNNPGYN
jgi:hypothetical protein